METKPVNFINLTSKPLLRGKEANFIYQIENIVFNEFDIDRLNKLEIQKQIKHLTDRDALFKFQGVESNIFKNNLVLVESYLPLIVSEIVLYAFINSSYSLSEILENIEKNNPLGYTYSNGLKFYTYKTKEFLRHLVLGMKSNVVWHGGGNIYDHYPILKVDDEIVYYTDNTNKFIDTLFDRTFIKPFNLSNNLDKIYYENGKFFIRLNLRLNYE